MTFTEDTTDCNGASSTVIANMYCLVPMSTLSSSPYNLTYGTLVVAQVQAYNADGWGPLSPSNTAGATILTAP